MVATCNLNYFTFVIFALFLYNQIEIINCKSERKYVTYTATPGYEKYVDDEELKSRIKDNQSKIESELENQFKHAKTINESLKILKKNGAIISDSGLSDGIKFQESTIGLMEAPIFLIEPPLLLPFDKFKDDEFSENLMRKTGLTPSHKTIDQLDLDKLHDPHKITDLHEAKIAKALFKQELKSLMEEKKALLDRMEELENELVINDSKSARRKFSTCSKEIHELDSRIKDYLKKIEKVNRVKRSIIKREGYSSDLMDDELEIEHMEEELEKEAENDSGDSKHDKKSKNRKNNEEEESSEENEEENDEEGNEDMDENQEDEDLSMEENEED